MATHSAPASLAEARFLRDELTDIAQRAQTFTSASGSVITMLRDDKLMVCARAGTAPEIGVQIPFAGSLAGRAIQSGRTMRCNESETEATVDLAALRPLRVRALAVIPLGSAKSAVRGALIVLSESTSAFNNTQLAILRTLADLASEKLQQGNVPVPPAPQSIPATIAAPAEPKPSLMAATAAAPVTAKAAPPSVPAKPSAPSPAAAPIAPVPRPSLAPPAPPPAVVPEAVKQDEPLVEPLAAALTPIRIAPAPRPRPVKLPAAPRPYSHGKDIFSVPNIELPRRKPAVPRIAIPAGILVTVVIAGALWAYRGAGHEAAPPVRHYVAVPISQVPGGDPPAPVPTATAQVEPPVTPTPQPAVTKAPEPAKPAEVASVHHESKPAAKTEAAKEQNKQTTSKQEVSELEPVTVNHPIRRPAAIEPPAETPVLAPTLNFVAGNKAPELPTAIVAPPTAPVSKLVPAELMRRVSPTYPPTARQSGLQGTVVLRARISAQGQVSSVAVVSGAPLLAGAAAEAVKQWRYRPALLNGSPVESVTEIVLNFKISK